MKFISSVILAALVDGRERSVTECLPYWRRRIDPATAVRVYHQVRAIRPPRKGRKPVVNPRSRPLPPLEKQIEIGANKILERSIKSLEKYGAVIYQHPEGYYEGSQFLNSTVQLSPDMYESLWNPKVKGTQSAKADNGQRTRAWQEFFRAIQAGWITATMVMEINQDTGPAPELPPDEEDARVADDNGKLESDEIPF